MTIEVQVGGGGFRPYRVVVGAGVLDRLGPEAAALGFRRALLVSDATVAGLHGPRARASLTAAGLSVHEAVVPPGEASKSFDGLRSLLEALASAGLDRHDLVVALGGGVVGDLAGLAAALWMRGVALIQVPTTLLAQVDSSVGGKTAIDLPQGKNLVGAFHQPRLVLADVATLGTLPPRQVRSGWAEALKHGLICDRAYFDRLAGPDAVALGGDPGAMTRAVVRSVEIKSAVVAEDEREAGRRALLNLGHTFGHAVEAELGFDDAILTHGEAVALGCALAFRFSVRRGQCAPDEAERLQAVLAAAGLPTGLSGLAPLSADALIGRMAGDKKAQGGRITLILARRIGEAFVETDVDPATLRAFLVAEGATA